MARYSMYFGTRIEIDDGLKKVSSYLENKKIAMRVSRDFKEKKPTVIKPLVFNVDNEPKVKFNLEDLDALTCNYQNEEEFITALSKMDAYKEFFTKAPDRHLIITHQSNNETKKTDVIYGNQLLKKYAYELRRKDDVKQRNKIRLSDSKELNEIIKKVMVYALNPVSSTEFRNSKYCEWNLKNDLNTYVDLMKKGFMTPQEADDLLEVETSIRNDLHKYKTLRGFIVWEDKSQKKLQQQTLKEQERASLDNQYRIVDKLVPLDAQKQFLEEQQIMEENKDIFEELSQKNKNWFIDDEKLAEVYQNGGIEAVLENMDADDIYTKSRSDLEKVGILPEENQQKRRK